MKTTLELVFVQIDVAEVDLLLGRQLPVLSVPGRHSVYLGQLRSCHETKMVKFFFTKQELASINASDPD
jgi:hypothetical protein